MSIQQLDQATNRFGTTKVGDFLNNHTSPDGTQLIDDPDIPAGATIHYEYTPEETSNEEPTTEEPVE